MRFEKGKSGNPKGRPKGVKNKVREELRNFYGALLLGEKSRIAAEFKKLTGKDLIKAATDLNPYVLPKQQHTTLDNDVDRMSDEQVMELWRQHLSTHETN